MENKAAAVVQRPQAGMKESGVQELGAVPAYWEVVQLGRAGCFEKCNGGSKEDNKPGGVPCVRYGDIYMRHKFLVNQTSTFIDEVRASDYTQTQRGDVLFAASGETIEEIGKSVEVVASEGLKCGGDLSLFRSSREFAAGFLGFATDSYPSQVQKSRMGRGVTVMHVYPDQLKYLWLAVPPVEEQAAIVRYLVATGRDVNRYLTAKRRLALVLWEQRAELVERHMFGGLEPGVPMSESGVEWIGRIPRSWRVIRGKYLFREVDSRSANGEETLLSLRMHLGLVPHKDVSSVPISAENLIGFKHVADGQIVMNRMRAATGMFALADAPGLVSPDYAVLELTGPDVPEYFVQLCKTGRARSIFRAESKGLGTGQSGFLRLYTDRLGAIKFPMPSPEEQRWILKRIRDSAADIDLAIARVESEIRLIREYRDRLVADVVTGKLDVREAALGLPKGLNELADEWRSSESGADLEDEVPGDRTRWL